MSIKTYEIHNSFFQDAPGSRGITRMVSEADYLSQLQQTDALQTSLNNIINAFGISGEGAHSKLVIEYVSRLVAENVAIKAAVPNLKEISYENDSFDDASIAEEIGFNEAVHLTINNMQSTPNTDAFTAELRAQGVALAISHLSKKFTNLGVPITSLEWLEVELRAGRKE